MRIPNNTINFSSYAAMSEEFSRAFWTILFEPSCSHLFLAWLVKRRYRLQAPRNYGPLGCKREYVRYVRIAREMKAKLCCCARAQRTGGGTIVPFIPSSAIHRCKTRWREAVPAICLPGAGHLLTMVALRQFHYSLSPRMDGTCALNISYAFCRKLHWGAHHGWDAFERMPLFISPPLCHNATCSLGVDLSSSANDCVLPSTLTSASCRSSIEICSGFLKAGGISPHKVRVSISK